MADSMIPDSAADMWVKMTNDTMYIVSPDGHPTYGTGARNTFFVNIGPGDFPTTNAVTTEPDQNTVVCSAMDIVVARSEDGNYVKVYIESIDIQNNMVTLLFAFQNIVEFPYF
jgi:hypothetical protein